MSDFLNRHTVLVLNALYQCIGTVTPKKALVALNSTSEQNNIAAKVIDVIYKIDENGILNLNELDHWRALSFDEWLAVNPRDRIDNVIHTQRLQLRCPTVIVTNYSKMPMKRFRVTKGLLYEMQRGICGYSGEKIPIKRGNLEHKKPKSHGGKDTFENLMFVKTEINNKRGNKPLAELGLKPLFSHKEPKPLPAHYSIRHLAHPDWKWFVEM